MSHSFWPYGLSPARFLCLWNFPGNNTGMGCHSFSRGSSWPRDRNCVCCIVGRFFTTEPLEWICYIMWQRNIANGIKVWDPKIDYPGLSRWVPHNYVLYHWATWEACPRPNPPTPSIHTSNNTSPWKQKISSGCSKRDLAEKETREIPGVRIQPHNVAGSEM